MTESITQKRCKKCGGTEFYKGNHCKACSAVYDKNRHALHREKENAQRRKRYAKDPQKALAKNKKWRDEHPGKKHDYDRKYYVNHAEEVCVRSRAYNAKHLEEGRARSKKRYATHREEALAYANNYDATHREEQRLYRAGHRKEARAYRLMREFGITLEKYDNMFTSQHGVCAICGSSPNNENLCVDHNHSTGKIRGLLCRKCNSALGVFENAGTLAKAQVYLAGARE
uniref:Putative recombination endonuclease VII n=1 Tax=viral metagenome TaxID=1070528 RepID=A0A6M3X8R9_9ZZZZ